MMRRLTLTYSPPVVSAAVNDPVAFRAAGTTFTTASSGSWAIDNPDGIVADDVLIAFLMAGSVTQTFASAGWTDISGTLSLPADGLGGWVFWKAATGSEGATTTFTCSPNETGGAVIAAFSGVNTTTPIDTSGYLATNASSLPMPRPTATAATHMMQICAVMATRTLTKDASTTLIGERQAELPSFIVTYEDLASSGQVPARTFTSSAAITHQLLTIVLAD
jgi:hypothetical protein